MSVKYDPWRQRPRRAPLDSSTPDPGPVAPPASPAAPEQAPEPQHAPPQPDEERAALRTQLAQLDRDELVELAGEYDLPTHRVRTTTLLDQLAAAGAKPPTAGVTRKAGS